MDSKELKLLFLEEMNTWIKSQVPIELNAKILEKENDVLLQLSKEAFGRASNIQNEYLNLLKWIDINDELPPIGVRVAAKTKDYDLEGLTYFTYNGDENELNFISEWMVFI